MLYFLVRLEERSCCNSVITLVTKVSHTSVLYFIMWLEITRWWSSMITLVAWISYTFRFRFLIFPEITTPRSKITLVTRVSYPFMLCFLVWLEIGKLSSGVLTLITRVSYPLMLGFLVWLEIGKLSSGVPTSVTRVSYPLMLGFLVWLEMAKLSSRVLALVTKISYSFLHNVVYVYLTWQQHTHIYHTDCIQWSSSELTENLFYNYNPCHGLITWDQGPFRGQVSKEEKDRERKTQKRLPKQVEIFLVYKLFNIRQNYPSTGCNPCY